jgi:hypothetical protein
MRTFARDQEPLLATGLEQNPVIQPSDTTYSYQKMIADGIKSFFTPTSPVEFCQTEGLNSQLV